MILVVLVMGYLGFSSQAMGSGYPLPDKAISELNQALATTDDAERSALLNSALSWMQKAKVSDEKKAASITAIQSAITDLGTHNPAKINQDINQAIAYIQVIITPVANSTTSQSGPATTGEAGQDDSSGNSSAQPAQIELYDVDAMAARMAKDQDYYQKLRDELLAMYAKQNPRPAAYDDMAREILRLGAYYLTWGDPYGEGVLRDIIRYKKVIETQGCLDPLIYHLYLNAMSGKNYPNSDADTVTACKKLILSAQEDSPAALRLWEMQTVVITILKRTIYGDHSHSTTSGMEMIPEAISLWEKAQAQLIKDKAPVHLLYTMPAELMGGSELDLPTMSLAIAAIDQAYNETGTDSGLRWALDGDYFIGMAWTARGSGLANTVGPQQFEAFGQYLNQAQSIFEAGYAKYPGETKISKDMLIVALGQGLDRETMETWFQRAIKADPNEFDAWGAKAHYLQPRWYGSVDDVWKAVQESAATQNWSANIPMVLAQALTDVSDIGARGIFKREDVWKLTESVYRKYLEIYPRSTFYRTYFMDAAYRGEHWAIAREQYTILGNDWDNEAISWDEYKDISKYLYPHKKPAAH